MRSSQCLLVITFLCVWDVSGLRMHSQQKSTVTYDNLKSQFESSIDYKYYDNLKSPATNFYYGTITQQAYQMRIKLYKLDDYEQCSPLTPYATKDMQSCMNCPSQKQLFNLGTRQCQVCKPHINEKCDQILNVSTPGLSSYTTNKTTNQLKDVNAATTKNSKTNTTIKEPSNTTTNGASPSKGNAAKPTAPTTTAQPSSANIDSPYVVVWQPNLTQQQKQANSSQKSQNMDNLVFQPVPVAANNSTLHSNYTIDYRVSENTTTNSNQASNDNFTAESSGQNITFANQQCPPASPYFNPNTKSCQNCKENQEYVPSQKKCLVTIYIYNPKNKYVILQQPDQLLKSNLQISKQFPQRTVRTCPIEKPLALNNICIACSADKIFNFTKQQCQQGCPQGQIFSQANSKCIEATFLTNSDAPNLLSPIKDFEIFRSSQKLKVKSSSTIVECPLTKPIMLNAACSNCPSQLPLFNIQSQECQTCTKNRNYDSYSRKCLSQINSGLQIKKMVPNIF